MEKVEDKIHYEEQNRKPYHKRKANPSISPWSEFQIKQIFCAKLPRANMSLKQIAEYIYYNISGCTTGQTFVERHDAESKFGHSITGIRYIIEQAICGLCERTDKTEHGVEYHSPCLKEMLESGEFKKFAEDWIYRLKDKRVDSSITTFSNGIKH